MKFCEKRRLIIVFTGEHRTWYNVVYSRAHCNMVYLLIKNPNKNSGEGGGDAVVFYITQFFKYHYLIKVIERACLLGDWPHLLLTISSNLKNKNN
jgi:hypothetical protein